MAQPEFGNGWQSPRISFSVNLSQTDREQKRSREGKKNYNAEFEFCSVSSGKDGCDADSNGTLISADELFVDGKILPQTRAPRSKLLDNGSHASLKSSSPVRSASHNLSNASRFKNDACKSARRPSIRWKKIFKLCNNKDHSCPTLKEAGEGLNEGENEMKNRASGRSRWLFSKSGREKQGSCLLCALPFSRSKSAVERKSIGAESGRKILVSDSKPLGTSSSKLEDLKKPPDLPNRAVRRDSPEMVVKNSLPTKNCGRGSTGRRTERFMLRNSKSLVEGGSISMRVIPLLNMPAL